MLTFACLTVSNDGGNYLHYFICIRGPESVIVFTLKIKATFNYDNGFVLFFLDTCSSMGNLVLIPFAAFNSFKITCILHVASSYPAM